MSSQPSARQLVGLEAGQLHEPVVGVQEAPLEVGA